MVNTSFMVGGAVGLAVLASLGAAHTQNAASTGTLEALNAGYRLAFAAGAGFVLVAAAIAALVFRPQNSLRSESETARPSASVR